MSTTNKTTSTNQYDPTSQGVYSGFQGTISSGLRDFAQNPLQATYFNNQLQMANRANQDWQNSADQTFFQNQKTLGNLNNPGAFAASELAKRQRAGMARSSNTFNNLLLASNQVRMGALGQMQGYRPLQTGQTQTQSQSGLGTWLPQVVGMGVSAFTGMPNVFGQSKGGSSAPSSNYTNSSGDWSGNS